MSEYAMQKEKKMITVIKSKKIPCAYCHGTGQKPKDSVCPVCGGETANVIIPPAIFCVFCHGRGEETAHSNRTCLVCRGRGANEVTPPLKTCPACRASGKTQSNQLKCATCGGVGYQSA